MTTKEEGKLKINCLIDSSGGSNMLKMAFEKLTGMSININNIPHTIEVSFVEVELGKKKLEEFMIVNSDVFVTHWILENSASEIDWMCQKYNCQFYNFYDDFVDQNAYLWHPMYQTRNTPNGVLKGSDICAHIKQRIILQAAISSLLIATTQPIVEQLTPFSDAIHLSPNSLPYGEGQYQIVNNRPSDDGLMRILVIGSSSHFNDFKEIKNIIKKISSDTEINTKAKWVIAGVIKDEKEWMNFVNMFSTSKMKVEVIEAAPIEDYMKLYGFGDVVFQPLTKNFFNEAKSSLKIAEASCHNLAVIGSSLYSDKELTGYLKCEKPLDYYKWVKHLVHNQNWVEMGNKLSEINRNESNFTQKVDRLKQAIQIITNRKEYKPKDLAIYGITYKDDQFTEYIPTLNTNTENLWRFEYGVMVNKLDEIKSMPNNDFVGFFSWKFPFKTNLSKKILYKLFDESGANKPDVLSFAPKYWKSTKEYLNFSNYYHPKLKELLEKLSAHLGLEYTEEGDFVTYSNFFLMKRDNWIDYLENYVKVGLEFMENEAWEEYNQDANYTSGLPAEELEKFTGMKYYNYVTFVLERLIIQYIYNKQLTTRII